METNSIEDEPQFDVRHTRSYLFLYVQFYSRGGGWRFTEIKNDTFVYQEVFFLKNE